MRTSSSRTSSSARARLVAEEALASETNSEAAMAAPTVAMVATVATDLLATKSPDSESAPASSRRSLSMRLCSHLAVARQVKRPEEKVLA